MGQCVSCCDDSASRPPPTATSPAHNGHTTVISAAGGKPPLVHASPLLHKPAADTSTGDQLTTADKHAANPAAKSFGPYAKLPPIRKHSGGSEGARGLGGVKPPLGGDSAGVTTPQQPQQQQQQRTSGGGGEEEVDALFDKYRDEGEDQGEEDVILAEGIERLCSDLQLRPEEFRVLVLAWKFGAATMCQFTRGEVREGCAKLGVTSVKGIRAKLPSMLAEVREKGAFKDLYRWTYKFGLEAGQRTLPTEVASVLWKLVFTQNEPSILQRWLDFLQDHPTIRGIPKDTWDMFLNLTEAVGEDLSNYDDTEAWPSLFDDFVEYENDRQNQNVTSKDIKAAGLEH